MYFSFWEEEKMFLPIWKRTNILWEEEGHEVGGNPPIPLLYNVTTEITNENSTN